MTPKHSETILSKAGLKDGQNAEPLCIHIGITETRWASQTELS